MKDDIVPPNSTSETNTQNISDVVTNPASSSTQQETPAAEPSAPQPETAVAPAESGEQPSDKPQEQNQQDQNKPKKKRGNGLVISLAVLVMVALAGLAAYIGFFADKSSDVSKNNSNQTSQSTASEDKQAVDQLAAEAESLPDNQDDSGNNLSDDQLGL